MQWVPAGPVELVLEPVRLVAALWPQLLIQVTLPEKISKKKHVAKSATNLFF
jgi:hypothetical protein